MKLAIVGLTLISAYASGEPEQAPFEGHSTYYYKVKDGSVLQIKKPLTQAQAQELHDAYEKALKDDASLATGEASLRQQMQNYRLRLKAAMVQADPKIAPLFVEGPGQFAKEPFPAPGK